MKNKTRTLIKSAVSLGTLLLFMLVLPWLATLSPDGLATTGLWMLAFFAVYPVLSAALGILAGTEISRLWWVPVATAALFPPLFSLAIGEFVADLYVYSAFYLPLGALAMTVTHFAKKSAKRRPL